MVTVPANRSSDFPLEIARGRVAGFSPVNKFGRNPDVDTATTPEDIWDGGGLWVAPTQARVHNIASSNVADTAAGTGARTVRVYGLTSWSAAEVFEDITLNGTSDVATANSYVIIHRMKCLSFGSGRTNAGNITATAITDATVTAQITAGQGQTLMAIYGVPSGYKLYLEQWDAGMNRAAAAASSADVQLQVNERADQSDSGFLVKRHKGLASSGDSNMMPPFRPPLAIVGPAIVKVQAENVSANDTDISAGFDGVLVVD